MGWGRTLFLGDIGNQLDIRDTQAALRQISDRLRAAGQYDRALARDLESVQREHDEVKLYLAALVRLLIAKGVVDREEIVQIVDSIDRADGRSDGKFGGPINPQT
jgi:hypothetical protein